MNLSLPTGSARTQYLLAFVLLATALVYMQSLSFQFCYDDEPQIVTNPRVHSFRYVPNYFLENVWAHEGERGNYFRPLFLLALLLQYKLFGLHVWAWHLVSIAFHVLATWLVFHFARDMLGSDDTALIAALLFGLAPVHVEVVVWASAISDSMIAVFVTASFLFYLRWRNEKLSGRRRWLLAASLLMFICALLTKEPAITFAGVLVAYEVIYRDKQESWRRPLLGIALFGFTAFVYLAWRTHVLYALGYRTMGITPTVIAMTIPWLAWFCASKLMFAWQLSSFYDAPYVDHLSPEDMRHDFWLPLIGVVVVIVAIAWFWRATRNRFLWFALVWMVLPLLPLINLGIFNEHDYAHDRYLYLPSVAGCTLIAYAISRLRGFDWAPRARVAVVAALAISYSGVVLTQSIYWASGLLLYERGARICKRFGAIPRTNLAGKLLDRGDYEQALAQYLFVLHLKPNNWLSNVNVGDALFRMGRLQEAEKYHMRAVELNPTPETILRLGLTRLKEHDLPGAEEALRQAVEGGGRSPSKLYALALCLKEENKLDEARDVLREAVQKAPDDAQLKAHLDEVERDMGARDSRSKRAK